MTLPDPAITDGIVRAAIYRQLAATGSTPTLAELAESIDGLIGPRAEEQVAASLHRLHDAHAIVLDPNSTTIRMALPFAGAPTEHRVTDGRTRWFANCAWDALAIPLFLRLDSSIITSVWMDDEAPLEIEVTGGRLADRRSSTGFVHFLRPARRWWDDIVET